MKKIFSIIIIGVLLITGCGKKEKEPDEPKKEEAIVIEDQQIGSLNIHSFSAYFDEEDKQSYVYFEVLNTSQEVANVSTITYDLYEGDRLVISIPKDLKGPIEPNGTRVIKTSVDINLDKINKVKYDIK